MRCTATGICLLYLTLSLISQTQTTGRLAGIVKDQNNALIVGANVAVNNSAETFVRTLSPACRRRATFRPAITSIRLLLHSLLSWPVR